ncbi:hypothetical protein CURE108131_23680 [Cupriavidus respiraculi]|uniref:Uncharacterized protein n=1 Tax=Cupriavidus respiraculi TaxID=195930 RepID=A0ABM8X3P4_9BURK|nr:hypothetical protein LMG21510_02603 [Cupriavidus respiraculi]
MQASSRQWRSEGAKEIGMAAMVAHACAALRVGSPPHSRPRASCADAPETKNSGQRRQAQAGGPGMLAGIRGRRFPAASHSPPARTVSARWHRIPFPSTDPPAPSIPSNPSDPSGARHHAFPVPPVAPPFPAGTRAPRGAGASRKAGRLPCIRGNGTGRREGVGAGAGRRGAGDRRRGARHAGGAVGHSGARRRRAGTGAGRRGPRARRDVDRGPAHGRVLVRGPTARARRRIAAPGRAGASRGGARGRRWPTCPAGHPCGQRAVERHRRRVGRRRRAISPAPRRPSTRQPIGMRSDRS